MQRACVLRRQLRLCQLHAQHWARNHLPHLVNIDVPFFFLTSVYMADAMVASGVLPCAFRKPRSMAILGARMGCYC